MMQRPGATGAVFAIVAGMIVASTAVTYFYGRTVINAHAQVAAHRAVISESELVLSTLKDAETGQRGFIITGDERYLEPFNTAVARLPQELNRLRGLTVGSNAGYDFQRIHELVHAKLDELHRTIELRRTGSFEATAGVVAAGEGKRTMDALRTLIGEIQAREDRSLTAESAQADKLTRRRTGIFAATALVNLLFLAWAYRHIAATLNAREAARREAEEQRAKAHRQRELLSVTLASIGDCVIVTDHSGRISFMNPIAAQVTGWSIEAAHGRPTHEVFKIINETTRQPVEHPVEKVIKSGVTVGLANHTLLIRRDGSEVPIDDSGAPIRDDHGNLHGVVLVFRDFTARRQAERDLQQAKEQAESANRAKDHFLAMLSHELRTPLTPVLAMLSTWEAAEDVPAGMRGDVQMMRRNVELEARIIDDLLDLTRIARGMLSFAAEDADVHELISFLLSLSQSEIHDKQLKVQLELNADRHHVHTDASRLQQVLWNILRNAIKFTDRGGSITVATANDAENNVSISITDTGIGMTPERIARLAIPFEQTSRAGSDPHGGLGLGMAISHALVELLRGKLTAESAGPGKGSTFTVTFPTIEVSTSAEEGRDWRPLTPERPLRILLVEDHGDTARVLVRLLKTRGFQVETADSVASAIVKVEEDAFDLLLCDIGLPDGTGFELIEQVRKTCDTPALALSGFGTVEDVSRSRAAGFEAHLTKPVNFQKLEATIWQLTNV